MQFTVSRFPVSRKLRVVVLALLASGAFLSAPALAGPAEQLFQTAQSQYQGGDLNKAIASLQQALAARGDYVEALSLLGSCYVELGEFDKAVDPYHHAFQLSPNDPAILRGYQTALENAGQQEPQIPVLHTLFQQNPSDVALGIKYLAVIEAVGPTHYAAEYAGVLETLRKTPNADPSYNLKLAKFYLSLGKYAQAATVFKDVVVDDPEGVENWKLLAQSLDGSGDRSGAKDAYEKAILYSSNADERTALEQAEKDIGTGKNVPAPTAVAEERSQPVVTAPPTPAPVPAEPQVDKAAQARAEAQAKADADRQARADAQAKADADRQAIAQAEADKKAAMEADRQAKAQAEADRKAALEADRQAKAQADSQARADAQAKADADRQTIAQAEADKKAAMEADRQAKAQAEADRKAALEADRQAKAQADSQAKADAQARADADRQAKAQADADKQAALEADRQAKAQAEADRKAALEADRQAKAQADSQARADAQARALADSQAKAQADADKKAAMEADRQAKEEAARIAREEAAQRAKERADSIAQADADKKAAMEADRQAKEEAARIAREEAAQRAKERADSIAQADALRKAHDDAERQFLGDLDAVLTQKPSKLDTLSLLTQIQDRRAASRVADPRLVEAEGVLDYYQMNYSLATEQFRKLKVLSPLATRLMALSFFELQDYPDAIKYFAKMPGVRENASDWGKYLRALVEAGKRGPAAEEYEAYLIKNPDSEDALAYLIDFYRAPLQKDKLISKLEMRLAKNPKDAGLLTELVGMVDKSSPKAIEYRQRLLEVSPDDNNVKLELAKMQEAKGNRVEAIRLYEAVAGDYSGDKAFNLKLADLLLQEHKTSDAVKYLEIAQSADPMDKTLILHLAGLYEEAKQNDKAREAYLKAFDVDSKDKAVQAKLLASFKSENKDQRRDVLMRIDGSDPTAHAAQFELAKMSLEDGDKDRAYEYLSKALKQQPQNPDYQALLPSVVTNDNQVAEYLPLLENMAQKPDAKPELQLMVAKGLLARQDKPAAARYFAMIYAKQPKLLEGNRDAIIALNSTKQYPAVAALSSQYLASTPDDREVRQIQVEALTATGASGNELRPALLGLVQADAAGGAKYLLKLANLDLQAHDTAAAVEHAQAYLEANPKALEGWRFLYPIVSGKAGQEDLRIKTLEQLWAVDPAERPRYDRELSDLYFQKERYDDAQKSLLRAVANTPADAALWYRLGEVEMKQRHEASAAQHFAKAYQLHPENAEYARSYGQTLNSPEELKATLPLWRFLSQQHPVSEESRKYAQSLFLNDDFAGSAKVWDALVKENPDLAKTEPMVAESYVKSGQLAKARGILESRLQSESGNVQLLESVALLYKQENNNASYIKTLENIVQIDPKYKGYLLVLAQEKEKAKDEKGALDLYDQWVTQTPGDVAAIKSVHRLAGDLKDTLRLTDALVRLNRVKGEDIEYRYQMAEIDFLRGGNLGEIEKLLKLHPEWKHGKEIVVHEYLKQDQKAKLAPYLSFLEAESQTNKNLLEPLGDIYAMQKKNVQANTAYWNWLQANPKNRQVFDKVYTFAKSTSSTYMPEILRLGAQSYPDDAVLLREYAASLGNTPQALTVYQGVLAKESDTVTLEKAINVAIALKQFEQALKWLDKWSEQSPENSKVWEAVLSISQQTGNKSKQIEALNKLAVLNPARQDVLQNLGKTYEEQSKPEKAAGAYKRLLALDPKNRDVFHKLKTLLAGPSHQEEFKAVLLSVDSADPTAHEAQFDLARIYLAGGDKEKAYEYLAKALKLQPQNPEYQALLPAVITKDEQVQLYLPILDHLAQMPGAKPELEYAVARGYLAKKNNAQAVRFLMSVNSKAPKMLEGDKDAILALQAEKQYAAAGSLATKYLAANPKDKEVRAVQVDAYMASGKSGPELREAFKGLVENYPEVAAKYLLKLAELDLQAKDTTAALAHGREFAANNPKSLEAWHLVYPLAKGRKGEEAVYLKSLEALSVLDTAQRTRYDRELVDVYFQDGKYDEVRMVLQKELKRNPRDAAFWFRLGEVDSRQKKDTSAALSYAKAYEIEPGNAVYARAYGKSITGSEAVKANLPLWKFLAMHQSGREERQKLAQSLFLNGDYPGAARVWDSLIPEDAGLRGEPMVSQSYLRAGQYSKARVLMEARLKTDTANLELLEDLLLLNEKQPNPAGYLNALERIVQIDPKIKNYQLLLAQEKEKAKDKKGALDQYDQYVARTGGDPVTLESMHRLADDLKDTVRLVESLVRLNRERNADVKYKFQMAAVDYARGGSIAPIEKLVKQYPAFSEGRMILVKEYLKKREAAKLAPHTDILDQLAREDRSLSEAAGDVYVQLKQPDKANEAYFAAFNNNKKDKILFSKVYEYAKKTNSPYRISLLKQGYETFTDDVTLKFDYAESLGKSPRALEIYNQILAGDPNQLPALRSAAEVSLALGKTDSALILLRRWSQQEPGNIRPWSLLADIYQRSHKDAELAEALGQVSQLSPKDGKAAYAAAQAYRKIGDKEKALTFLNTAATLSPEEPNYQKEQALLMVEMGQADKAKASLLVIDKKFPRDEAINKALYNVYVAENDKPSARERMRILYSIKPYSKAYALSLGSLEGELNNPVEAARILSLPALRDTLDSRLSFMLLDAYFKTNQKDRAAVLGPQLLQKYPSEAKKSLPLGVLFYNLKNPKAKEILEAYVSEHDSSVEASYYLGKIYFEEKNWHGAVDALEKAKGFQPDVTSMLAESYAQSGEFAKAARAYEDYYAKAKDPKTLEQLYKLYKQSNDTTGGVQKTLERLLAINGNNLDYRAELASFYLSKGDEKKAEEQFQEILKINPSHPLANFKLGGMLAKNQDWAHAAPLLEIGAPRFPDSISGWLLLGDADRALKRPQPALLAYKRAQKVSPQSTRAAVGRMEAARDLNMTADLGEAASVVIKLDSGNVEAATILADIQFQAHKYADAAALYARVVANAPDDKDAWVNYGQSLVELKRTSDAKTALQKAVDLGANDPRVLTSLARIYQQEGNTEKAEAMLNDMLKKDPKNSWAFFGLGQIAADRNQPGVAEDNFRKAYQLAPNNGEYSEALARLLYAKDDCPHAIALLEGARASLTTNGRLLYGRCLVKEGKPELAMAQIKAVYEKDHSPGVLATLADLYVGQGKIKDALSLLDSSSDKEDPDLMFSLAKAHVANGDYSQAHPLLDELISKDGQNSDYYFQRGLTSFKEHNWSGAQDDFASALKYNADQTDAVYYTGMSLLKQGKTQDAQNSFKELADNANKSLQARGFYGMALAFDADGKLEAVENYVNKSIAAKETPDALILLARLRLRQNKPQDAEKPARRVLELVPGDAAATAILAEMNMALGHKDLAQQSISKALQNDSNSCELQLGAAEIYFRAGNLDQSYKNGLNAITICPDDPGGYFFLAIINSQKNSKKEAKRFFGEFVKHGGHASNVPEEYR